MPDGVFRFRERDSIGAVGAEEDEFLSECFVDTGDLSCLEDMGDRRIIVLGRTGAGKTALLREFEEKRPSSTIVVSPDELALTYVSNSTVLSFFASLGVNLDPFFKLLWRHVIVVEILTRHVASLPIERPNVLTDWLKSIFSGTSREDKEMREAVEYLNEWGKDFWLETEYRVKEITEKLEADLTSELSAEVSGSLLGLAKGGVKGRVEAARKLTEEQKSEIAQRGQQVVSRAQVRDLNKVMKLLSKVLQQSGHVYYVLIDRLDDAWAEDRIRYRLIMALLETARDFVKIKSAKVVVALRRDLIERVFRLTRDAGFQEEKYDSLTLPLVWSSDELIQVLDKRIDRLVRRQYTKSVVSHHDLLPTKVRGTPISEYFAARTERPRDVIAFFNSCIQAAPNLARLSVSEVTAAEGDYSRGRLKALGDEWSSDYPALLEFARLLNKRKVGFRVGDISTSEVEARCLEILIDAEIVQGQLLEGARSVVDCVLDSQAFRELLIKVFYAVGLVGLKLEAFEATSWSDERGRGVSAAEVNEETRVYVHPMFYRVLGIDVPAAATR